MAVRDTYIHKNTVSLGYIDLESVHVHVSRNSSMAARLAAGASTSMMRAILSGQLKNGFAFVRPPGHHAESRTCMGFCLYNNAAIAAKQVVYSVYTYK